MMEKKYLFQGGLWMRRLIIADDEPIIRKDLRKILEEHGFLVVGEASDGFDAIEICRNNKPDLVLMDVNMPFLDGINAAGLIMNENLASSVVLISEKSDTETINRAKEAGVMGYLVKPIDKAMLLTSIEIAIANGEKIKKIKHEYDEMKENLDNRKIIERAKGIMMKKYGMDENEAYNHIRKLSMDKRCTMKQIASTILLNHRAAL